jgi:hypothetical protein
MGKESSHFSDLGRNDFMHGSTRDKGLEEESGFTAVCA